VLAGLLYFLAGGISYTASKAADATRQQMIASLEAALRYEAASRLARGRSTEIAELAAASPVRWMQERPLDYLGEYPGKPARLPRTAVWYWETGSRRLVFVAAGDGTEARNEWHYRIVVDGANQTSPRLQLVAPSRRKSP